MRALAPDGFLAESGVGQPGSNRWLAEPGRVPPRSSRDTDSPKQEALGCVDPQVVNAVTALLDPSIFQLVQVFLICTAPEKHPVPIEVGLLTPVQAVHPARRSGWRYGLPTRLRRVSMPDQQSPRQNPYLRF